MKYSVVVVDDHTLLSQAIEGMVNTFDKFKVLYTCKNGKEVSEKFSASPKNIPDIVLVDYADILMPTGNFREKRHALGNIYEDLRGLAGELEIPIWTASQANRSALEEDVIGADKIAEDYSKIMTADFVMSMSRKVEDKIANTGRFHVIKNRFGVDGITYPATINTNIGQIQVFEGSSQFGKEAQHKMNNSEEFLRKELANKYKDMENNVDGFE